MTCDRCDYMASRALPDHRTEMYFQARDEAYADHNAVPGFDPIRFVDGVLAEFDTLTEHRFPMAPWSMLAFVRRHTLAWHGVATMRELEAVTP